MFFKAQSAIIFVLSLYLDIELLYNLNVQGVKMVYRTSCQLIPDSKKMFREVAKCGYYSS